MIDLLIVLFIGSAAIWAYKKGFILTLFHSFYFIIAAATASIVYPLLSDVAMQLPLSGWIQEKIVAPYLLLPTEKLPLFLASAVKETTEATAAAITATIVNILCILVVFLLVSFGLRLVAKVLHKVACLPVLSFFNRLAGLAVGLLNGAVVVYILLAILSLFPDCALYDMVQNASLAGYMLRNNLLIGLIFRA